MIRLDRYLSNIGLGSRSTISLWCKNESVLVNDLIAKKSDVKVKEGDMIEIMISESWIPKFDGDNWMQDTISTQSQQNLRFQVKEKVSIILYKPKWYVCSDVSDGWHPSYKELIEDCPYCGMLHVAGRLDFDTTWLVLVTSDGGFNHTVISPKHKLIKTYIVTCALPVSDIMRRQLELWVILEDGYRTLPAKVIEFNKDSHVFGDRKSSGKWHVIVLQISEGKYHQVKRMLEAVCNEVVELHRASIGERNLQWLIEGERKYL